MTASMDIDVTIGEVEAIQVGNLLGNINLVSGNVVLYGWSIRETSGAAVASVDIASGSPLVASIGMSAGSGSVEWFGPLGVACPGGVQIIANAGSWTGAVYLAYCH